MSNLVFRLPRYYQVSPQVSELERVLGEQHVGPGGRGFGHGVGRRVEADGQMGDLRPGRGHLYAGFVPLGGELRGSRLFQNRDEYVLLQPAYFKRAAAETGGMGTPAPSRGACGAPGRQGGDATGLSTWN